LLIIGLISRRSIENHNFLDLEMLKALKLQGSMFRKRRSMNSINSRLKKKRKSIGNRQNGRGKLSLKLNRIFLQKIEQLEKEW
jgi:hypothetical protein